MQYVAAIQWITDNFSSAAKVAMVYFWLDPHGRYGRTDVTVMDYYETKTTSRRSGVSPWMVLPLLLFTLALGLAGGFVVNNFLNGRSLLAFGNDGSCPLSSKECNDFGSFWQAWQIASRDYVDPKAIDPQKMTDGAISGMLESLGDEGHTRYMSKDVAKEYQESLQGSFDGIGAYIDVKNGQAIIVQPIEESPAERAGIKPNDVILKVDGADMTNVTVEELRAKVRGPRGTSVRLTIQHANESSPVEITVQRDEIKLPSTTWRMLSGNIALIKLSQFSATAAADMQSALKDAKAQGATKIILDLRNNPGGYVTALVDIASELMPANTVVLYQQDRDGQRKTYNTHDGGIATDLPLVVLINNNTASAAEILAGALRDQGRAKVIGEPTFGTATVLNQYDLEDGGRMLLGTSQWLTPKGQEVRGIGIAPDEKVALEGDAVPLTPREAAALSPDALQQTDDTQLRRALEVVQQLAQR